MNGIEMRDDFTRNLAVQMKVQEITNAEYDTDKFIAMMYECMYSKVLDAALNGRTLDEAYKHYMENEFPRDMNDVSAENLLECHDSGYVGGTNIIWELPDGTKGEVEFDAVDEEKVAILWYRFCQENKIIEVEYIDPDE